MSARQAAQDVLTDMGFRIDKYDVDAGVITTLPLTGGQFFEVWRGDNASSFSAAEANLHSIKRVVELTFAPSEGQLCMLCDTRIKRLSLPEKEVAGTTGTRSLFTKSSSQLMAVRLNPAQERQMAWIDMGSDAALAAAAQAVEMFCYHARKTIGSLAAVMGGVDLLVFAGGIGENAAIIRALICRGLEHLGIELDPAKNCANADVISSEDATCAVRIVRTNEDLMIARHTYAVVFGGAGPPEGGMQ